MWQWRQCFLAVAGLLLYTFLVILWLFSSWNLQSIRHLFCCSFIFYFSSHDDPSMNLTAVVKIPLASADFTLHCSDANFLFSVFNVVQGEAKTPEIMGCCRANFALLHALKVGTFRGKWALEWVFKTSNFFRLAVYFFKAGPLDLSFWSFLTFLHHGIEKIQRHLLWRFRKKKSKEKLVKCATEVARLHKVSIQSCTHNRPSPKVQSRSGDWI